MDFMQLNILLVEDNEEDYFLTREFLSVDPETNFKLDWVNTFEEAMVLMCQNKHHAYLVDYYLGNKNGLQLLQETIVNGCSGPIIMITGRGDGDIDTAAIQAGAADYLIKDQITPQLLARSIRHAIQHKHLDDHLRESEKHYRSIFENATIGVFQISSGGDFITVNSALAHTLGYQTPKQMLQNVKNIAEIMDITPGFHNELLQNLPENQTTASIEKRLVCKDGRELAVRLTLWVVRNKKGITLHLEGFLEDITDQKRHEYQQEAILKVATALRTAKNQASMLPILLDQLCELFHANCSLVSLRDPINGDTVFELGWGDWASATGERLPEGIGINGLVIVNNEVYYNNNVSQESALARPDLFSTVRAVLGIPLNVRDETIGGIWIGRNQDIAQADIKLMRAIGEMAANAIYRTSLHEETENRLRQLQSLNAIEKAITNNLDVQQVLNVLLHQVTTQLPADAADILLYEEKQQLLKYVDGRGFKPPNLQPRPVKLPEGMVEQLSSEYNAILIPNLRSGKLGEEARVILEARLPDLLAESLNTYYGLPLIARENFKGLIEIFQHNLTLQDPEWLDFLQTLAGQAAIAIDNATLFEAMQKSNRELMEAYESTLEGWARALEYRDRETRGHSQRVTYLTSKLSQAIGVNEEILTHALRGALLHDIGKMGIPDNILLKPMNLSDDEWEVMRCHPSYEYEMLSPISFLKPALNIPYSHHEKWNGQGYPKGLQGEEIPLEARIFAVVDVWDALRSDRPYRKAWSEQATLSYIKQQSGEHFDPHVVDVFCNIININGNIQRPD